MPKLMSGESEPLTPVAPVSLSEGDMQSLRLAVIQAFPPGWGITFLSMRTGLSQQGQIAACGVVTGADLQNDVSRNYIFRAESTATAGQTRDFRLIEIGDSQTQQFQVFSNCTAMKLL